MTIGSCVILIKWSEVIADALASNVVAGHIKIGSQYSFQKVD